MIKEFQADHKFAAIILAHNEELVIGATIRSLNTTLGSSDAIIVVADNCNDETAQEAKRAGAQVLVRSNGGVGGKGEALGWLVNNNFNILQNYSMAIILDADSLVSSNFVAVIKRNIRPGNVAYQTFVRPQFKKGSSIGNLGGLSELIDQHISDRIRSLLKWSVRLRGTGMVIPMNLFISYCGDLHTNVEDIALTLILCSKDIFIVRIDEAILYDPKPQTLDAAAKQRARWFNGQWKALWSYRVQVMRILHKGPAGWSLLSSLFLRPKILVLLVSAGLAIILSPWYWVSIFFCTYFFFGSIFIAISLLIIPERSLLFPAILHAPAYLWMWSKSIVLSLHSSSWHRARK